MKLANLENNAEPSGDSGAAAASNIGENVRCTTGTVNQPTALSAAECQANYEEFVRTFAVPTHLYRYLASRHRSRPTYLTRNLRYMYPMGRKSGKKRSTVFLYAL